MSEHKFRPLHSELPLPTRTAIHKAINGMAIVRAPMFVAPYEDEALTAIVDAVCDDTRKAIEACFKAVETKMKLKPALEVQKLLADQAYHPSETMQ